MPPSTKELSINDLHIAVHGVEIVFNVNLKVEEGETLALIGRSGSGKTTAAMSILQLLNAQCKVTNGEIWFDGERLDIMPSKAIRKVRGAKIGMIFQDPSTSLNPSITIGKQIAETLSCHENISWSHAKETTLHWLNKVGINHPKERYNCYPFELSGGMKQRVMIAMALICNPKLLIADEPTTALDVTIQGQILKLLHDLIKEHKMSMLLITHNLSTVAALADRVAVMQGGTIIETTTAKDFFFNTKRDP